MLVAVVDNNRDIREYWGSSMKVNKADTTNVVDILFNYGGQLLVVLQRVHGFHALLTNLAITQQTSDWDHNKNIESFRELQTCFVDLKYDFAAAKCDKIIGSLERIKGSKTITQAEFVVLLSQNDDLRETILLESKRELYYRVPSLRAQYFELPDFPQEVFERFVDAQFDILEFGKCMSLGRYTAAVFHLMRMLDSGLREVYTYLHYDWKTNPSWESMLDKILKHVQKLELDQDKISKTWRRERDQLNAIYLGIRAVKNVWRNSTMHPDKKYLEPEAEIIYKNSVMLMKDVMGYLP